METVIGSLGVRGDLAAVDFLLDNDRSMLFAVLRRLKATEDVILVALC